MQETLDREMELLIKKKKLQEIDAQKIQLEKKEFEIYKRKMERDMKEVDKLREFKRKMIESGHSPDTALNHVKGIFSF